MIASDTTDADGNDETAGSTYVVTNNSAGQQVITYTNILGQVYLIQQSDSSTSSSCSCQANGDDGLVYSDDYITFNANGQAIEQIGFDGVSTFTDYDPMTGLALGSWTDNAGNGIFTPGVDSMQVSRFESPPTTVAGTGRGRHG